MPTRKPGITWNPKPVSSASKAKTAKAAGSAAQAKAAASTPKPIKAGGVTPAKDTRYVVKKGDNLTAIAKAHGTTLAKVVKLNPSIKDPNKIWRGTKVRLK